MNLEKLKLEFFRIVRISDVDNLETYGFEELFGIVSFVRIELF